MGCQGFLPGATALPQSRLRSRGAEGPTPAPADGARYSGPGASLKRTALAWLRVPLALGYSQARLSTTVS